jgi:hypothetical protein
MTTLSSRPYIASNPSSLLQRGTESINGYPVNPHDSSDPTVTAWHPAPAASFFMPATPTASSNQMQLASYPKIPGVSAIP